MEAEAKTEVTRVIFRRWKSGGGLIALFPDQSWFSGPTHQDRICKAYQNGTHEEADYWAYIKQTWPTLPREYDELKSELEKQGYQLEPIRRWTRREDA